MKIWTVTACLALALGFASAASSPSHAQGRDWSSWSRSSLLQLVDDDSPATGCLGFQRKDGRWTHDCGFGSEEPGHGGMDSGDIARQLRAAGYSEIYDIERDGDRFKATAIDPDGDAVRVYFDAETGEFIKQKRL